MGCSFKAISDDQDELYSALERTGLKGRRIDLYSAEANAVIKAARKGLSMQETITAINEARALADAAAKTREELEERAELQRLINKYGVPGR